IEDTGRQARFQHKFGELQRNARVALGRFKDEGIAAGDGRRELPQRDHGRKVKWRDARDDTERLAHRIYRYTAAGAVGELSLHEMGDTDRKFDDIEAALDFALRVGNCFAVLTGEKIG